MFQENNDHHHRQTWSLALIRDRAVCLSDSADTGVGFSARRWMVAFAYVQPISTVTFPKSVFFIYFSLKPH